MKLDLGVKVLPYATMGKALTLAYHFQVLHHLHYKNVGRSPWEIYRFYLVSLSLMQFPHVCSYQDANYTIVVLEKSTSNSFKEGPFEYVNRDEQHVRIKIQDGLRPNWNYTATVIVETVAESINSSVSFSKYPYSLAHFAT